MGIGIGVIGAGGHAKVVISTAILLGLNISFVIDDDPTKWGSDIFGFKIEGPIEAFKNSASPAILAIGDNQTRKRIAENLNHLEWITLIHPFSYVHPSAQIGKGTVVFAGAVIQPDAVVGDHCIINTGATVDHDCKIGNFVHLAPGTSLAGDVSIGEGAFIGIGAKVVVGKTIGDWTTVGAGGVVLDDLPSRVIATGIPAKIKDPMSKL